MKKRYLAMLLVLTMLLAGCGSAGSSIEEVSGEIHPVETEAEVVATEPAATERPVSMGRMEGGTYINKYAGYACELDSSWTFYGAEELQDIPENVAEMLEGSELGDSINTLDQFTDMMAENAEQMTTMNLLYQKHTVEERLSYALLSDEEILDSVFGIQDQMIAAYEQAGIEVNSMEKVTVTFLGEERLALRTSAVMQGVPYYVLQLFDYHLGQYSVTLTLASFVEDNTESLLDLFYAVD